MLGEKIIDEQLCWKYIKYEVREPSIRVSKGKSQKTRAETVTIDSKLKELGKTVNSWAKKKTKFEKTMFYFEKWYVFSISKCLMGLP